MYLSKSFIFIFSNPKQWRRSTICRTWPYQKMPPPGAGSDAIFMKSTCSVNHGMIFWFLKTFEQELSPNLA